MLLRSSSTPILNSWLPHYTKDSSSSESYHANQLTRSRSLSLTSSLHLHTYYDDHTKISQVLSSEASSPNSAKNSPIMQQHNTNRKQSMKTAKVSEIEEQEQKASIVQRWLFSSSYLGESSNPTKEEDCVMAQETEPQTLVVGGEAGNNGGKICCGGGSKGSNGGGGDDNHGSNSADSYYQRMIEENPGNALLLGNYAKYLKEVEGDMEKAEELCGRAILANPTDGNILSLYADLLWNLHKDASRAESYYDQALKSAPDDCYVLASYAKFLWEVEDDDEDDEKGQQKTTIRHHASPHKFYQEAYHHHPITAAS